MTETNGPFVDDGLSPDQVENGYDPVNGATCPIQYYGCESRVKTKWLNFMISMFVALVDKSGLQFDCNDPEMAYNAVYQIVNTTELFVEDGDLDPANLRVTYNYNDPAKPNFTINLQDLVSELFFDESTSEVTFALGNGDTTIFNLVSTDANNAIVSGTDGGAYIKKDINLTGTTTTTEITGLSEYDGNTAHVVTGENRVITGTGIITGDSLDLAQFGITTPNASCPMHYMITIEI